MMYMPSIFNDNFVSRFFDDFDKDMMKRPVYAGHFGNLMKTDIKEMDKSYMMEIELPGYDKDNIEINLNDGYIEISAEQNVNNEEKDDEGKVIRKERYSGAVRRSYYVGDEVKAEDINASFDNGILEINIPKPEEVKEIPEKTKIEIK